LREIYKNIKIALLKDMEQHLISVDLGGSKVVAALGKRSVYNETIVVDVVEEAMDGYTSGEITNIKNVTTAIQKAITNLESRNSISVSEVWVSASGKHLVCSDNSGFVYVGGAGGEITERDVEKLHENMNNVQAPESKIILARIPQNYKVDAHETIGSPVGQFGNKLSTTFSFVLGGKAPLERISDAFGRAHIPTTHFVAAAMASASVAASQEEKEAGVAVIDLGAGTTDLCIIQNNVVRYAASIPIGSAAINKDIQTIGVPNTMIEKLKTQCGYATASAIPADKLNNGISINTHSQYQKKKTVAYRDLTAIIEARMLDIIDLVNNEIKASGYHDRLPNGIILTGGGSLLNGVEILFREHTGYEVRLGTGEFNIAEESIENTETIKSIYSPAYATVLGLLNLGIEEANIEACQENGGDIYEEAPATKEEDVAPANLQTTPKEEPEQTQEEENEEGYKNPYDDEVEDEDNYGGSRKPKEKKQNSFFRRLGKWANDTIFGGDTIDDEL
jgi:cell division protein FtsA